MRSRTRTRTVRGRKGEANKRKDKPLQMMWYLAWRRSGPLFHSASRAEVKRVVVGGWLLVHTVASNWLVG